MILERWDLSSLLRDAAKTYRWAPGDVWELTPFELVALFGKVEKEAEATTDKLTILQMHNDIRAKRGLRPMVPKWWGMPPRKISGGRVGVKRGKGG